MKTIALVTVRIAEGSTPELIEAYKVEIREALSDYAVLFQFEAPKTTRNGYGLESAGPTGVQGVYFYHPNDKVIQPTVDVNDLRNALRNL